MHFCCDQKKIFTVIFFLRLKVKICTFFSPDRFTANGLPHCYSQTRVGEQGGRARALREVWFLFSSHNTRGLLLTPQASSKQVDLAASVADQLRACSQAQLKPSAEPDEGCSSLFQVLRQKDARKSGSAKDLVFILDNRSCRVHLPAIFRAPTLLLVFFD